MADIDIKDLGDAAAIADTDEIIAIISGLGKNVKWAKFKELLISQLPEASGNSKGLMSSAFYNLRIRHFSIDIKDFTPNKKLDTGFAAIGLYVIEDASGYFEVIGITAYTNVAYHVTGANMLSDGTSQGFALKRDANDGNIFVTNKFTSNKYFTMSKL